MALIFAKTRSSFAIEIDRDKFLDLLDSESHVTGNAAYKVGRETLCQKLEQIDGVSGVEYSGHFGAAVYLTIESVSDTPDGREAIRSIIKSHLDWCRGLEKVAHVVEARKIGGQNA